MVLYQQIVALEMLASIQLQGVVHLENFHSYHSLVLSGVHSIETSLVVISSVVRLVDSYVLATLHSATGCPNPSGIS